MPLRASRPSANWRSTAPSAPVPGALPAAIGANAMGKGLICPEACGAEAAWAAEDMVVLAAPHLLSLVNHFKGIQTLSRPEPGWLRSRRAASDLPDVKGQESAKRALEIAAAGGHNLLMVGPPGRASRCSPPGCRRSFPAVGREMLEVSMVNSLAGELADGRLPARPFRAPHHSASMAALVGGGTRPRPGEVSPRPSRRAVPRRVAGIQSHVLDALRQPLETGEVIIARANHRIAYPSRFQLVAAMNPCKCGGGDPGLTCRRGPRCAPNTRRASPARCSTASICKSKCRR